MGAPVHDGLAGRRVLLVHEDAFMAGYLGAVIASSGAALIGPVAVAIEGIAWLNRDPRPCALVLSTAMRDDGAVARVAAARRVPTLLVQPARGAEPSPAFDRPVLIAPFAGFQVVDALLRLLAAAQADPARFDAG